MILVISLFALFAVFGISLAMSLGLATLITVMFTFDVPLSIIVEKFELGADNFLMIAIPLFVLAANIMNYAGVSGRIFRFARALVGNLPGALGHANILASVVFAGISGSAIADSAALGKIEIKSMESQGYPSEYAAAITCASATIGPIIPPSIPMVIYAGIASESVGRLFIAGIIPGMILALVLMIGNYFISKKRNYPKDEKLTLKQKLLSFVRSFFPIMTPVIIVGGIVGGVFTPTEAAAFTALYAFILGFFVYRELKISMFPRIIMETIETSAIVMFIVSAASAFNWVLTVSRLGTVLANFAGMMPSPMSFMFATVFILLILGMFMESTAILIVITPFLVPIAQNMGINLVYFGVVLVLTLMIGLSTPPFGMGLFTVAQVSGLGIEAVVIAIMPFIPILLAALVIITLFPALSTWLPTLLMNH
jgi:tripartite ATP-independent transporter DctM subunit